MNVVFHINDPERWGIAARNAKNTMRFYHEQEEPCQVELVANGAAVRQLKKEDAKKTGLADGLARMVADGAVICACIDSMEMQHISPDEMLDFVQLVPVGVVEMAQRQMQGFAYIKP